MHNIRQFFYNNKKTIFKIVGITALVLIVIQLANSYYKNRQKEINAQMKNNIGSSTSTIDNSDYVINKNKKVNSNSATQNIEEVMKEFVNYCNTGEYEKAYNLLTDDCKDKLFKTQEIFEENYIKNVFYENKTYTMQAWDSEKNTTTYQVHYMGDVLATGKTGDVLEDYYTFVKQSDETYKININNFIYSEKYDDLVTTQDGIEVQVLSKDAYKNYVIYEFQVLNKTQNRILLNGNKMAKKIYLVDNSGTGYSSLDTNFEGNEEIVLNKGNNRKFRIKFNKTYNTNKYIKKMIISDIILDYDEYLENTENYNNRIKMQIELR